MISIISLLALIMYSHVVVSQHYRLKDVTSHAGGSAAGETSYYKTLSYNAKQQWNIGQGDCLQVREDDGTIIYNIQLGGRIWRGVRGRFKDPTVENDLDTEGYPKTGRSVWIATPRVGRGCRDGDYKNQRKLIGQEERLPEGRGRSAVTDFSGHKKRTSTKKKKKTTFSKFFKRSKKPKPLTVKDVHRWQFEPTGSGGKELFHYDLSRGKEMEHVWSFKTRECIVVQFKESGDYEFALYCLKENGKWEDKDGHEIDDDGTSFDLARYDESDQFELWSKTIDGTKEVKERVWPKKTGTATAAADAYVEYEDEMDGFASKYDGLLAEFEYDVEVEEAREKKAMTHLAKEKYDILRAKNRKNKY